MINALYIHIPFCNKICTYCDFFKMVAKPEYKTKYIDHLVKEIYLKIDSFSSLKTIYIGGGTPTALPLNILDFFLYHLTKNIDMNKIVEFTIEANPIDITAELVTLLRKYGVNRVSLGVQSFNDEKLTFLGREHSGKQASDAVNLLREGGITNINIDVIYAAPNDTFKTIKKDIITALKLQVTHISTYSLILEEKTILYKMFLNNQYKEFDQDVEYKIYTKIRRLLKLHGFTHYEISNFAKKNYQSIHNKVYWTNQNYLGLGAGASYYIGKTRYTNSTVIKDYVLGVNEGNLKFADQVELTEIEIIQEEMILGLRMITGVDLNTFTEKYNQTIFEVFPFVTNLIKQKFLKITKNNHLIIPKKMLYLSNVVLQYFI